MTLQDKINQDIKEFMKSKDELKLATLRMIKADIQYELTKTGVSSLNDEQVIAILRSNSKKRKDTAEEYKKANRQDLADKEESEIKIIVSYLPPELPEGEIVKAIEKAISDLGAKGPSDMGKVIGKTMQELKGKNPDGSKVSALVKSILSK